MDSFTSIRYFTRYNLRHLLNQSDAKRNQSFLIDQSNFISLIVNLKKNFNTSNLINGLQLIVKYETLKMLSDHDIILRLFGDRQAK